MFQFGHLRSVYFTDQNLISTHFTIVIDKNDELCWNFVKTSLFIGDFDFYQKKLLPVVKKHISSQFPMEISSQSEY